MNALTTPPKTREQVHQLGQTAGTALIEYAKALAAWLDKKPEDRQWFIDQGAHPEVLRRLEMYGRNQIHETLIYASSRPERELLKLPLSEQTLAIEQGIEVLEDDEKNTRKIPVAALTPAQTKQVFASGAIRSLAEQRSIIQERKRRECRPVNVATDYHIHRGVLEVRGVKFTLTQLTQIVADMSASK